MNRKNIIEKLVLLLIIALGFQFRYSGVNWDSNQHLHPDERFLTMVGTAASIPNNLSHYLNQDKSTLNPRNLGFNFYVYGTFPLTFNKIMAVRLDKNNYDDFTILGRKVSAFFDLLVVLLVYKTAKLLIRKADNRLPITYIPLWAAFFYAVFVLPIQLSHFFAVDTFLNFFMFASFYFVLRYVSGKSRYGRGFFLGLSAVLFGLALGSKATAFFILPLNVFFIFQRGELKSLNHFVFRIVHLMLYLTISYFVLRFADPYLFQNPNIFDPTLNQSFIANIKELRTLTLIDPDNYFPPNVQWISKNTIAHSVVNNVVFGLGIFITFFILFGIGTIILNLKKSHLTNTLRDRQILKSLFKIPDGLTIILIWVFAFFVYQGLQTVPALRYFLIIYPYLAIFAGIGISNLQSIFNFEFSNSIKISNFKFQIINILIILFLLIWPVMFSSIYKNKHTRVAASEWIYKNFKNGAVIANEHWDDGLPLLLEENYGKHFTTRELPVFHPDTEEKWQEIKSILNEADYYILSSNRGWGSIPTVPEKYPRMSKFYSDLFANKLNLTKIAEFTSYPKLCLVFSDRCLVFKDDWADEPFTVYDHPRVIIFRKTNGR